MNDEAKRLEPGSPAHSQASQAQLPANSHVKLLIEFGPLAAFGITYLAGGIFWATAVVMVTSVIALAASWRRFGRLLPVPLLTAVLVVVFGGLTFWLNDPRFIKVKPTIINLLFAGVLLFGLMTGRPLLKLLLGEAFKLTEEGWRKLSVRWAAFFLGLAGLNEVVWRNFSEASWVNFKVFGILGLSLVFAMAQVGLIKRYEANEPHNTGQNTGQNVSESEPRSEAGAEDQSRASDKVRAD
jgi:intracellular septation protein